MKHLEPPSFSGPGSRPFKPETTGSTPAGGTALQAAKEQLHAALVAQDAKAIATASAMVMLNDPEAMEALHQGLWLLPFLAKHHRHLQALPRRALRTQILEHLRYVVNRKCGKGLNPRFEKIIVKAGYWPVPATPVRKTGH